MPSLQTSGPISILNVKTLFGGPAAPAMSNYYRGGTYIPATVTTSVLTYEPAGGGFTWVRYTTFWYEGYDNTSIYWDTVFIVNFDNFNQYISSYTVGIYTYYRGGQAPVSNYKYIRRTYMNTVTTQINTGVPSSGQISMSQFYGATTGT
jgi:hypothetical protein